MNDIGFGKLVEKLIYFSGQKNYSLARELGYDVSYISKWINSTMLPSAKNIKNISKAIAEFIVQGSSESSIDEIKAYFKMDVENCNTKEQLITIIEEKLNTAYLYSYNSVNKKNKKDEVNELNSKMIINPSLRKRYLIDEIMERIDSGEYLDIIMLCNLFSINKDDRVHLSGNKHDQEEWIGEQPVNMRYILSFDENVKDIIFNIVLFINMVTSRRRAVFEMYTCDFPHNTLISIIKDRYLHTALYSNYKCIMSTDSREPRVIKEMYDTLEDMINTECRKTFIKKTPNEMIESQNYMKYIMGQESRILLGEMNELFMPSDLFIEIAEDVFENSEIVTRIKRIDTILQNATYNTKIDLLIYESALRKYVANGEATFFNIPVKLTTEQRRRHINHLYNLVKENENIDVRFIEHELVDEFKTEERPSLFTSKNMTFIKENANEASNDYLIIKEKNLDSIMKSFFDKVWNERNDVVQDKKKENLAIIYELLNYLEILSINR